MKTRVLPMFLALLAPAAQAGSSAAADGVLDLTFAVGGDRTVAFDRGGNLTDVGRAVVVDAEDRIYLVGDVNVPGSNRIGVARLKADGDVDVGYGVDGNGLVVAPAAGNAIRVGAAAIDAQGHLLVAGSRVVNGADTRFIVCRFGPSGSMVSFEGSQFSCAPVDFDLGGDKADHAEAIVVQPDGRIVLAGWAASATGTELAVARLEADGTLDGSFGNGGRTTFVGAGYAAFAAAALHQAADGSLLIAGTATTPGNLEFGFISRLDDTGQVDMEFGNNPGFARSPSAATVYTDIAHDAQADRIIVIGNTSITSPEQKGFAACHLPYGNMVACPGGFAASQTFELGAGVAFDDLLRQPDGRWLVAGAWKPVANGPVRTLLVRLERSLVLDAIDFAAPNGFIGHSYGHELDAATGVAMQRSRIVVAGSSKHVATLDYDYAVSGYAIDRIFASGMED